MVDADFELGSSVFHPPSRRSRARSDLESRVDTHAVFRALPTVLSYAPPDTQCTTCTVLSAEQLME